jgi:hypothetical protein
MRSIAMTRWNTAGPNAGRHTISSFGSHSIAVVIVLAAAVPLLLLLGLVPAARILPALGFASLMIAGVLALVAWWRRTKRYTNRINLWDVAGACAFIGFAAGIISQPEQVLDLFGYSSVAR